MYPDDDDDHRKQFIYLAFFQFCLSPAIVLTSVCTELIAADMYFVILCYWTSSHLVTMSTFSLMRKC